jgi:N-acetylmuramoyl-L-alanine amidase
VRPRRHVSTLPRVIGRLLRLALLLGIASACRTAEPRAAFTPRSGEEIVVCGRHFFVGTRVVLWSEPPGYDASDASGPHGLRYQPGRREKGEAGRVYVEPESDDLQALRRTIDQFVLHYDAAGTSERCFRVLQDERGLSVHFLLDVDGTIYQTLDLRDQAWHATKANPRSIGVEIANMGAHAPGDGKGIRGVIQGMDLEQPAFTPKQYESLARLAAALCVVFPRITADAPRDDAGPVRTTVLSDAEFESFHGILGHFHVQANKQDPGPAFDWESFLASVRGILASDAPSP